MGHKIYDEVIIIIVISHRQNPKWLKIKTLNVCFKHIGTVRAADLKWFKWFMMILKYN